MRDKMQIVMTWSWLWYAMRRLVRGRTPYLSAKSVPQLTGGPPTPWRTVHNPMQFSGVADAGAVCQPIEIEIRSLDKRPLLAEGGSWAYQRVEVDAQRVRRGHVRSPSATRRGTSSPDMVAVCC